MDERTRHFYFWIILTVVGTVAILALLVKVVDFRRGEDVTLMESALNRVKSTFQLKNSSTNNWKTYQSKDNVFSFQYPSKLTLNESAGKVELSHQVPFKNYGDCDMKGDSIVYDNLTDFKATFQIVNGTIKQAVEEISPYMPAENFVDDTLKINPGFIDSYRNGNLSGFAIYEGVEGCGHTIYYLPVADGKVLVATRNMVQILSGVISSNLADELLKVPGVINNDENKAIFEQILGSVKISDKTDTTNTTNWKTYRNEKSGFEMKYPEDWLVGTYDEYEAQLFQSQIRCVTFSSPDRKYVLKFGLKDSSENVLLCPRTGIRGGQPTPIGTIKIGNLSVEPNYLIYEGKAKEIFFTNLGKDSGPVEISYNGKKILAEFASYELTSAEDDNLDMQKLPEVGTAIEILSTFKFTK